MFTKHHHFAAFLLSLSIVLGALLPAYAQLFETRAGQALLLDVETNSYLFSKEPDTQIPPASLAKIMTMEVVFNALQTGQLTLDDEFVVSENAWRSGGAGSGGSTMFAELNSSIRLEDLIQGVIVQSANDGAIIIAEGMAGSEELFANMMNDRARKIGLKDSVFYNSTGLPHPDQKVTMRDLVTLTRHIQTQYPKYFSYYSVPQFTWNKILQRNRNPLLKMDIGATGMKTGYTEASGYAIVGTMEKDGRSLILAMSGLDSIRDREVESRKMLQWGERAFEPFKIFERDEIVGQVRLYGGESLSVDVAPKSAVTMLVPLANQDRLRARIVYEGPVKTPISAGDELATLNIYIGDQLAHNSPLYATNDVGKGPIYRQALDAVSEYALGLIK